MDKFDNSKHYAYQRNKLADDEVDEFFNAVVYAVELIFHLFGKLLNIVFGSNIGVRSNLLLNGSLYGLCHFRGRLFGHNALEEIEQFEMKRRRHNCYNESTTLLAQTVWWGRL